MMRTLDEHRQILSFFNNKEFTYRKQDCFVCGSTGWVLDKWQIKRHCFNCNGFGFISNKNKPSIPSLYAKYPKR